MSRAILPAGAVIGILGGGQLGRMMAMAAAAMGYRAHIFAPAVDCPAFQVAALTTKAPYEDEVALGHFADAVDRITLEFENIPIETLRFLEQRNSLYPASSVVEIAQDRILEKTFLNGQKIKTARWTECSTDSQIEGAIKKCGLPAFLKTARFGYDGKGHYKIISIECIKKAHAELKGVKAILEQTIPFQREISMIVARNAKGETICSPPIENDHRNNILIKSRVPANLSSQHCRDVENIARRVADALSLRGLIVIEMFHSEGEGFLVNEFAPRPHNSGHWTIEGAPTSQFSQTIRAVAGWPLGSMQALCRVEMVNILGGDEEKISSLLNNPHASLHLYGKTESRKGRKMGHVTTLFPQ